jgi:transposase
MMNEKLFETALGIAEPWHVVSVDLDPAVKTLTVGIDFTPGSRFTVAGEPGVHPVHDTVSKRYRHLNFFQHECYLGVRVPRVKLPSGAVRQVEPEWAGELSGFTLLFEALVLMLAREMPFAAVARLTGESWHRVAAICRRYVDLALLDADLETIESVSIDMSPAFIKGCMTHLPEARITFDKFHVIAHASRALDETRRLEQKSTPDLKGLRWTLLRDHADLSVTGRAELDALLSSLTTRRTARAWVYREQLREILGRKQINVVSGMLWQWCTNVMRSKVEPMKRVAQMIRDHFEGIVAWAQTRQTNGFLEALNGLFQSAKRRARGYGRFSTIRTVIFLLAGKLDFSKINPHVAY